MPKTNTLAVVSLVCGALGWFMVPVLASIVAIVTGHMARKQIKQSFGREDGDGLAIGGLVLGYASLVLGLIGIVLVILVFVGVLGLGLLGAQG
ncbi:MAG TPA: DUF4190 domain-containing protein [Polyangiaceae bacterium]|nr:DUF4190 domain-containing protein [Polyangiaceae bacterium]